MAKPVRHHWSWALPKDEPLMEATGGGLGAILTMIAGAAAIFVLLVLIVPSLPKGPPERPVVTSKPAATPPAKSPPTTGYSGGGLPPPPSLPDCATVTDSRTACAGAVGEMPQGAVEEPAPQPTGTPEPRYVTETCLTPPGERPCWLPADAAWEPPVSVPETPVVLLPEPPIVDVCAMWHPPLPWPEGCDDD